MRHFLSVLGVAGLAALSACAPGMPDSGAGVGFDDYDGYLEQQRMREAQLAGTALPRPDAISEETLYDDAAPAGGAGTGGLAEADIAAETQAILAETGAGSGAPVPTADPAGVQPEPVIGPTGISQENDFDLVGAERTIADDAALIAQNRAQYQIIEPTALPSRSGGSRPNIVAYALETSHPPGTQIYRRTGLNKEARYNRNCAKYASPDRAQEEFLANGGPERDRMGLDPDGDGYACGWDPRPFRRAMGQ